MTRGILAGVACLVLLLLPAGLALSWIQAARARLENAQSVAEERPQKVAVAEAADEAYCTPELKKILRRVLRSCGLIHGRAGRGCKPMDAKNVATMSGDDFNALFVPMRRRGGIVQFDKGSHEFDPADRRLVEKVFSERRGASYFLVVARASPEGSVASNRELSRNRAERVMTHLQEMFRDPEVEGQVGLLWLGEEYAQLDPSFCKWQRSGEQGACAVEDLNRSAFIAWIDCRL